MRKSRQQRVREAVADFVARALTSEGYASLPGVGEFRVIHQSSAERTADSGERTLSPPRDLVQFRPPTGP